VTVAGSTAGQPAVAESTAGGLTSAEAAARRRAFGRNVVAEGRRRSLVLQVAQRFRNPLVILLVGSAAVSGATGDARSAVVIVAIVLLSVVLDFVQERRAGRAAERLRETVLMRATVVRDGKPVEIPVADVVPGDVVVLAAGDLVPADGRLIEARDLFVNQALLTGEPYPVEKRPATERAADDDDEAPRPEVADAVMMGTSVVGGAGRAVVVRTGARTAVGQIGVSLQRTPPPTSFEQGTRAFGLLIVRLALTMVLVVIFVNAWRGRPWLESFMFAIALAVGLTPELLPMVVSVTLSHGAIRMARRKVIVKRLSSIHDLGSMDVLCTDKTGTLTEARIRLARSLDPGGASSSRVTDLCYLNSRFGSGVKNPLDEAILAAGQPASAEGWTKLDELPFDFERRCAAVLVGPPDQPPLLVVKGALEEVLRRSSRYEDPAGAERDLGSAERAALGARFEALSREGFRVLGVATRRLPEPGRTLARDDERDLVFAGFAAFEDPPKESAGAALRNLGQLGITVKLLTGDNELVAAHVATQLGLDTERALTGAEIATLDDAALGVRAERATLFCRVTPAQKDRIILALKRRQHVVGFMGDGINDAPALHTADVGVSVDGAVDVAKEAADLILLEHDLGVLRDGVVEGRRTLGNIMKYVLMGTSSSFGNMFSMAGASLFLPFLPMLPIQILVNNFLYDLSEIPVPTDRVDAAFVRRPHRWDMRFIRRFMLMMGPVSSLFDFVTFFLLYRVLGAREAVFQTGWFIESLATQVLVIFVIRTRGNPLRSRPSAPLAVTALAVVGMALLLPLTRAGAALGFVRPPAIFFPVLAATVVAYLCAAELAKRCFYRHANPERAGGRWSPVTAR